MAKKTVRRRPRSPARMRIGPTTRVECRIPTGFRYSPNQPPARRLEPWELIEVPTCNGNIYLTAMPLANIEVTTTGECSKYQRGYYHVGDRLPEGQYDAATGGFICVVPLTNEFRGRYGISNGGRRTGVMRRQYPTGCYPDGSPVLVAVHILPGIGHDAAATWTEAINRDQIRYSPNDSYYNRRYRRDPEVQQLESFLLARGVGLRFNGGRASNELKSICRSFGMIRQYGWDLFGRAIDILVQYRADDETIEKDALAPDVIAAVCFVLHEYRDTPARQLEQWLLHEYVSTITARVKEIRERSSGSRKTRIVRVFEDVIQQGRARGRR